jgi:hypothetical protein
MPAMALTLRSLASAAKRRAERAQEHLHDAQEQLAVANTELDSAIPSGDVARLQHARERTGQAEQAAIAAAQELEVVGVLLADDAQATRAPGSDASGEGVANLVKTLRATRKQ